MRNVCLKPRIESLESPSGITGLYSLPESSATYFNGAFDQSDMSRLDNSSVAFASADQSVESQLVTRVDTVNRVSMPF